MALPFASAAFHPTLSRHGIAQSLSALALRIWLNEKVRFAASVFGGAGDGKKEMLRKKTHVVRKKTHVVRKIFYVASIFGGAAGRKNRSPWELSSTPWELSSTAGDFSSTASRRRQRLQCVYRAPVFSGGAHTSLPDTNIFHIISMLCKNYTAKIVDINIPAKLRRKNYATDFFFMFPASPTGGTWCVCVGTLFEVVVSFALLSDFTPYLFVSARRVAVSFTGVSRCRQLAATVKSPI